MLNSETINKSSDALIELLAAQCLDLEKLLVLAREETCAAEQGNFESLLEIVTRRHRKIQPRSRRLPAR